MNPLVADFVPIEIVTRPMPKLRDKRWYVYALADPDEKIFYIGKGSGNRLFSHELEAKRKAETYKQRKIRKIWEDGQQIRRYIVYTTAVEEEAYEEEYLLIQRIGRNNLTNESAGGNWDNDKYVWEKPIIEMCEAEYIERLQRFNLSEDKTNEYLAQWRFNRFEYLYPQLKQHRRYGRDELMYQMIEEMKDLLWKLKPVEREHELTKLRIQNLVLHFMYHSS